MTLIRKHKIGQKAAVSNPDNKPKVKEGYGLPLPESIFNGDSDNKKDWTLTSNSPASTKDLYAQNLYKSPAGDYVIVKCSDGVKRTLPVRTHTSFKGDGHGVWQWVKGIFGATNDYENTFAIDWERKKAYLIPEDSWGEASGDNTQGQAIVYNLNSAGQILDSEGNVWGEQPETQTTKFNKGGILDYTPHYFDFFNNKNI